MAKTGKVQYVCRSCGYTAFKWMGKCPDCGIWHTMEEEIRKETENRHRFMQEGDFSSAAEVVSIDCVETDEEDRIHTGIREFDRVMGGGMVQGSVILIGGSPGIGKSTLMLQALYRLSGAGKKTMYATGEESVRQLRMRAERLCAVSPNLLVIQEVDTDALVEILGREKPDAVVVDSIQTLYVREIPSAPGSVSQVRESAMRLVFFSKKTGIPVFLIGHVTKEGQIAGPRLLEHMVDTVLYFEGDTGHIFRILRAVKNRYGSTNEIGVFEMQAKGLCEVENPSAIFLSERPKESAGSSVTACMEGTRPILMEIQALVSPSVYGTPRRTVIGLDPNRVALLTAVMEKQLSMHLMGHDIFMNVAGGVKALEPAADIAVCAALASSFTERPIPEGTAAFGEIGLTGEVRAVGFPKERLVELGKMGFTRCILPGGSMRSLDGDADIRVFPVKTLSECIEMIFDE